MRDNNPILTEEQLDFTREMMNIGAGNAVTAMQMLLQCPVDLIIPKVHVLPVTHISSILGNPTALVACARMEMVGDIGGVILFLLPEESKKALVTTAENALRGPYALLRWEKSEELELSAIAEIGNIICGVYLTAIHDFCGLNISHTVPIVATEMIQSLLDESLVKTSLQIQTVLLVENEFTLEEHHIRTLMLIIPSPESTKRLVGSLGQAKKAYGSA